MEAMMSFPLTDLRDRHACIPLTVLAETEGFNMLIALQILLHAFSQRAGPLTVDDPDTGEMCECSVVNKFIQNVDHEEGF